MHRKRFALLLDEPRVGKTFTALAAAQQANASTVRVACPAIAREVWRRAAQDIGLTADFDVESYDRLVRQPRRRDEFRAARPDVLIADECHYLKTPDAARTRVVYGDTKTLGLLNHAGAVWGLTGTLIPNNLGEAWTHLRAAGQTRKSYMSFLYHHCSGFQTNYGWKVSGMREENLPEFLDLLRPISLRRRLVDLWPQMPQTRWSVEPLPAPEKALRELRKLEHEEKLDVLADALQGKNPGEMEAVLNNYALDTSRYQRLVSEVKRPLVAEMAREMLEGGIEKLAIFAWFTETVEYLQDALAEYGAVMVYGDTPETTRWKYVDRFSTDPDCRVFVGNIKSVGQAIPLDAARHAIFADSSWSLGDTIQAARRIVSPLRTDRPEIIVCSLAGTTDDAVARAQAIKADQAGVLNDLEGVE